MKTAPATPLPWIAMGFPQTTGWDIAHQDNEGHTSHIAHLDPYVGNQTNAAFIVRCVNSHQDLLDACKAIRDNWEGNLSDAMALVNAAIAKAEVQS